MALAQLFMKLHLMNTLEDYRTVTLDMYRHQMERSIMLFFYQPLYNVVKDCFK